MEILLKYELLKLLKDYKNKNMLADNEFITKAVNIILEKRKCLREVSNIVIGENVILFNEPLFDEDSKTLYIKSNIDQAQLVDSFIQEEDIVNMYNIKILRNILEICNEIKQKSTRKCDIASYLIYLNEKFKTTEINPCIRMAQIDAIDQIDSIISWLPIKDRKTLENYIEYEFLTSLLYGYSIEKGNINSPVFKYLNAYNLHLEGQNRIADTKEELMYKINSATAQNTLDENLYLGMPIDKEVYLNLLSKKEEINKSLQRKRS